MKSIIILFNIVGLILLSSCKDDTATPPPPTVFSVKISVKNTSNAPVAGLRISVWNHPPSGVLPGRQITNDIPASILSTCAIKFAVDTIARVNLSIFEFDGTLVSTLVDEVQEAGIHIVYWDNQVQRPPRVYKYRLIAQDSLTSAPLFRDSVYAVLWHLTTENAILGWTSPAGTFETSDKLFFPNVLNLPTLVLTSANEPDSIGTFIIPDSVTIALTDTATHQQMIFERVITKGVANDIQLVWNPALSKHWLPDNSFIEEPRITGRKTGPIAVTDSVIIDTIGLPTKWKLYQNYPNPYN